MQYRLLGPGMDAENRIKQEIDNFDPRKLKDEREEIIRLLRKREGAPAFQKKLVAVYGKCAMTGCTVEAALDAAHIIPYSGPTSNHVKNGLLLRADVHKLFDLELIQINPDDYTIIVDSKLRKTPYFKRHGKKLFLPVDEANHPSDKAIRER